MLNDGNGHFENLDTIDVAPAQDIYMADLNVDDHDDLVLLYPGHIRVHLNDGQGSFFNENVYGVYSAAKFITSTDIDNDGDEDLVITTGTTDICLYLNNGDGTFANYTRHNTGYATFEIISEDLDRDDDKDLVILNGTQSRISVIYNTGDGTINDPAVYQIGLGGRAMDVGEFNGDGYADIAIANLDCKITLLMSDGVGGFQDTSSIFISCGVKTTLHAADFDRDGYDDLITTEVLHDYHHGDKIYVLGNNGDGTFREPVIYKLVDEPFHIASADFNGDDYEDLLVVGLNYLFIMNDGNGSFVVADEYPLNFSPFSVIAADFDQDRDMDIAAAGPWGYADVSILENDGYGYFGEFEHRFIKGTRGFFSSPVALAAADFDSDNMVDLAVGNRGKNSITILTNLGNMVFGGFDIDINTTQTLIYAPDLDNDGDFDILAGDRSEDYISVLYNEGNEFTHSVQYQFRFISPSSMSPADFNGDGLLDIALTSMEEDSVYILENHDGIFRAGANYYVGSNSPDACAADLDNDNDVDLAVLRRDISAVSILYNDGTGIFSEPVLYYDVGWVNESIVAFDLEVDGDMDLATTAPELNAISILINNGHGIFNKVISYAAGDHPWSIFPADFNGDNMPDLVVSNLDEKYISVLINQYDTRVPRKLSNAVDHPVYNLAGNFPNPFNAQTTIRYSLANPGDVKIAIYNILGQTVETLFDGIRDAGEYSVSWDAGGYPSGVYFYRLTIDEKTDTRKMLFIK